MSTKLVFFLIVCHLFLVSESLSTVTPDGILTVPAPEVRRRSAVIVNRLRICIATCKKILVERFQVIILIYLLFAGSQ